MVKSILKSFGLSKSQSNPREEIEDIISEEGQKEEAFDAHEKLLLKNIFLTKYLIITSEIPWIFKFHRPHSKFIRFSIFFILYVFI